MPKKSNKNTQNTSNELGLSKTRSWMDFLDVSTLNAYPGRTEWRKRLIFSMLEWAQAADALEIKRFCVDFKIPYTTLQKWRNKYEEIEEAYSFMKMIIALNRREGSMRKILDGGYAYKDMHWYDEEWHSINKYHADLKKEEEKQAHTFIINTDKPVVVSKAEMDELMKERDDQHGNK